MYVSHSFPFGSHRRRPILSFLSPLPLILSPHPQGLHDTWGQATVSMRYLQTRGQSCGVGKGTQSQDSRERPKHFSHRGEVLDSRGLATCRKARAGARTGLRPTSAKSCSSRQGQAQPAPVPPQGRARGTRGRRCTGGM